MKDVIIVGGGIIGMLTARSLHDAGLNVMLIDKNELGKESTWAGGGILSPLYPWRYPDAVSKLAKISHQTYPELCAALQAETDIDPQYIQSGLVFTEDDEHEQAHAWAQTYGYQCQHLTSTAEIQTCEPSLAKHYDRGLFFPELGQVRNPRIAQALRTSLRLRPMTLAEFSPVSSLEIKDGRVTGVRVGEQLFQARHVILTAGAWTGLFPEFNNTALDIKPMLGQMILFRTPRGTLNRIVLDNGRYLIPRKDGRIVCGSTLEDCAFNKHTTEEARNSLMDFAYNIMPELASLPVLNHWCGLRPASPTGIPYIGEHPEIKGLYANAGHFRNGVILGPASVQLLVDMILGRATQIDATPYALNRTPDA